MTFDDRVQAVAKKGFTDRQARFLTTVILHAGVCVPRQYTRFCGIVYGEDTTVLHQARAARLRLDVRLPPQPSTHLPPQSARSLRSHRRGGQPTAKARDVEPRRILLSMPRSCSRGVGGASAILYSMEYVSRVPRPPLDGLIDDLYYLEGASPYARLMLPPMPAALLIVNLGAPFLIRGGTDIETAEYADGCVVTMPTRALEFGYPLRTRSVGVHFKPWGLAPFLPMPAAELCDRPVTVEQVWGRPAIAELRDRLATADGPHEMLTLLEQELMRRLCETAGLGLVRHTSSVIAATRGAVAIGDLNVAAGVSSTHLAQRFKELIGVTPKRLARTLRFAATVFAINPAEPIDWADLAGGAGYFDQAHFGHEFRAFTGLTPTQYVEVRRRFLREHPGHVLDSWPLPVD